MILEDKVSFEQYFVLQEGFSQIWSTVKKYGITAMELAKTFKEFHNRGFREITFHQGKAGIAARILLLAAYHLLAFSGASELYKVKHKSTQEKISATVEYLEEHPEKTQPVLQELKKQFDVSEMGF